MPWIDIEDRLPDYDGVYKTKQVVGAINPAEVIARSWYNHRTEHFTSLDWGTVTHWEEEEDATN